MKKLVTLAFGAALLFGFCSCASMQNKAQRVPVNSKCPVMPTHKVNPESGVVHEGHWVAFCCQGCEGKWHMMTEDEQAEFIADALAAKK